MAGIADVAGHDAEVLPAGESEMSADDASWR